MSILQLIAQPEVANKYFADLADRNATLDAQIGALYDAVLLSEVAKFFE
jgi:hypothetical protein